MMDFVAIDVETANADLASICQIGIAEYKDGALSQEWSIPLYSAPAALADIIALFNELTADWISLDKRREEPNCFKDFDKPPFFKYKRKSPWGSRPILYTPLAQFAYSTDTCVPDLASNWKVPLDKCFSDQIDWKMIPRFVNKYPEKEKGEPETIKDQQVLYEFTHFFWAQGGDFCFNEGDTIWLDRSGYESGIGDILQVSSATPAISAYREIEREWSKWPDEIESIIREIEEEGDRCLQRESKDAPKEKRFQLYRLKKRCPGRLFLDRLYCPEWSQRQDGHDTADSG
ncbi:MAG: hypothetical protein FWG97_01290 [Deltaproteobacteria bacterium]|nr:hypothetical protein [Deltaproteobacteria bacterium]